MLYFRLFVFTVFSIVDFILLLEIVNCYKLVEKSIPCNGSFSLYQLRIYQIVSCVSNIIIKFMNKTCVHEICMLALWYAC